METLLYFASIGCHAFALIFAILFFIISCFKSTDESAIKKSTVKSLIGQNRVLSIIFAVLNVIFTKNDLNAAVLKTGYLLNIIGISWLAVSGICAIGLVFLVALKPNNFKTRVAGIRSMFTSSLVTAIITILLRWFLS